ncbi:hypothetical protein GCM10007100_37530 [Roseibacillus persicicus]|uniref:Methyltransferase FkbM domain-containing protein n=2 Tax=Roseibacillus persicicus TaxID=454148 RepID=A0A918TXP2_9BACT|nr:hypothetical protein GCM10007100_37530 [Roseibacillus persicicus]
MLGRLQRPGVVIVDAGANLGEFTSLMTQMFGSYGPKIISVECQKQLIPNLEKLVSLNSNQVVLECSALTGVQTGETITFTEIRGEEREDGVPIYNEWGTINQDKLVPVDAEVIRYEVEQVTLGDLFTKYELGYIDYLKMDIEGAEEGILDDLTSEVAAKIGQWSLEYHRDDPSPLVEKLRQLGFETKVFAGDHEIFAFRA